MENSEILKLTLELKERIVSSESYINLKEKEKKMMENDECCKLLHLYQSVQSEYNEAKRFEKYGSKVDEVLKRLSEIKYKVDENVFVKEYNEAYKQMNKELKKIEEVIFKDIVSKRKEINLEI